MKKQKIAFIIGVTGQDGSYMSSLLHKKNYKIFGFTRSINKKNLTNLISLKLKKKIILKKYSENKPNDILKIFKRVKPQEVYYFAGQSSVGKSFKKPLDTYRSNTIILFKILEFVRVNKLKTKIYNSCSTDCFGNSKKIYKNEKDKFYPVSPYGNSKSFTFWLTKYYRENYNINCKSGILSNHESPLRKENFVLKKIINFLKKNKKSETLKLGNISVFRDWGWAPDYVEAIFKINNSKYKKDYLVGTGKLTSLNSIIVKLFKIYGADKKKIKIDKNNFSRPNEILKIACNSKLIQKDLNWKPKVNLNMMLNKLMSEKLF